MRKSQPFDSKFEAARGLAESLRVEAGRCVDAIRAFADASAQSSDETFLEQNGGFKDFAATDETLDGLLAELVFTLDRMTAEVSADLDSFLGLTLREKLAGWLSRQRMRRLHSERVRNAPVVEWIVDLLAKTDALAGLIGEQRWFLAERHHAAELALTDIIEKRRRLVDSIDIARVRVKELNAKALITQGRIGVYGGKAQWERMEEERLELKAEAGRLSAEERAMREESQRRERFIGMFQTFVDTLNGGIAICNVLLRKLMIDTEERLIIYQAQVDTDRPEAKARIRPELFPNIARPISLFEKGMLVPQDLERRKGQADLEFGKRFSAYAEHHAGTPGEPLIDTSRRSAFFGFKPFRS
ncbi:hypothetical protein [Rhizobium binxianense]